MLKYKLKIKDIKLEDFRVYLFALFKGVLPKKKIKNMEDLTLFIQTKSAWVSQVTLYNYLKTRMGTKWVLHFDDEVFLASINKAKWNIYSIALQDLTFYSLSYLNIFCSYKDMSKANEIYDEILTKEKKNEMPEEIISQAKEKFKERLEKIDWNTYYKSWPFNESALTLYKWAPVAEELKILDRKIVLNSMILKWENIEKEFKELIKI
ncbi:esterase [Candidatus Pelagibacter sp.]|nr:esterase [Candidatus Pelagibacter sp.]